MAATVTGKRRTVFIAVGRCGAGKTWFGQQLAKENFMVISTEPYRTQEEMVLVVKSKMARTRKHAYLDGQHLHDWNRFALQRFAVKEGYQVVVIVFDLPHETRRRHSLEHVKRGDPHWRINSEEDVDFMFKYGQHDMPMDIKREEKRFPAGACTVITVTTPEQALALSKTINERA